jgi:UDP-N-acetylmuramate: L-alanyl-gamma-D-glutamyl-meso-diaminopimelate ligase
MGALAGLLCEAGHQVRGSDGPLYPPMSTLLESLRVEHYEGYRAENLDWGPERVVVGNICRIDHPEAVAARERGLSLTSFPALLSELFLSERGSLTVAGTHGKTTTSALLAHVLASAGLEPGFLIGGIPRGFGRSFALGAPGAPFVVEGDEYDTAYFDKRPKFVHYRPRVAILTGVEFDHADIYPTIVEVEHAFSLLIEAIPEAGRLVVCADSPIALRLSGSARCQVESYSVRPGSGATWRAEASPEAGGRQRLRVRRGEEPYGELVLPLTGRHNAENALAVTAVAAGLGVEPAAIGVGLASFAGVRRRQELRGRADGVAVIDDFAHHPTAIRETIAGLRGVHGEGRLIAVFEPRSATSRRRVLQDELIDALATADAALIGGLHDPDRIPVAERLEPDRVAEAVRERGISAVHLADVDAIVAHLGELAGPGDTVLVMSSGGFGGLIPRLLARLEARASGARR